jgi:hypothetical protein
MKTGSNNKDLLGKKFLFSKLFANLYYFFALHLYTVLLIIGFSISVAILLFVAEFIFPKQVHFFGYAITDKMFTELVSSNKYHAAVSLIETNKDVLSQSNESYRLRTELADCYVHIGDYPKALEQYNLLRQEIQDKAKTDTSNIDKNELETIMTMIDISISKEEFRIYLKMGDKYNINAYYKRLSERQSSTNWEEVSNLISKDEFSEGGNFSAEDFKDGYAHELIQGEYLLHPDAAIKRMDKYIQKVLSTNKYNPIYKLKVLNTYINMLIEQSNTIKARAYLEYALDIVDSLKYNSNIYESLGNLSECCFALNDIQDGKELLKKYLSYIDDKYDATDIDYIMAHYLEFKYLEKEGDYTSLITKISHASSVIRTQITKNFAGMTASQREFFIEQFQPMFKYANNVLESHPNTELAKVCFENNMFLRGLLLRSDASVSNAIHELHNKTLTNNYEKYIRLSKELTAREYISGPGNYVRKRQLSDSIHVIESEIAHSCRDFQRMKESTNITLSRLHELLNSRELAVQIIEGKNSYYALIAGHEGDVKYVSLGNKSYIDNAANNQGEVYVSGNNASSFLGELPQVVEGMTVYYTTSGIFNKIAVGAIEIDDNRMTLNDVSSLYLFNSIADVAGYKESLRDRPSRTKNAVLWGGIYYDEKMALANSSKDSNSSAMTIKRGNELRFLPGSAIEIQNIESILQNAGMPVKTYTGASATEQSFTNRTGKKDFILHISTHGFFDDKAYRNPMQNAGLLFANSQYYWMNDSLSSSLNKSDGILRADEIAQLNLNGCSLVVLSACQTGLGTSNSEGVYGLQRAFKLAGAQSILMSLWNVEDKATTELMVQMYSNLMKGLNANKALYAAQKYMRTKGYSPDKWAAFILLN